MVDLDEMKQKWAEYDRKLDQSIRLNWELLKAANLNGARTAMQRMTVFLDLEALVWFVIVVALGSFIHDHLSTPQFALPGMAIDLYAIGMLAATIRQIAAARHIDYGQPIVAIQRQVEGLRVWRIRTIKWGVLGGTAMWAPFAIVMFRVLFGIDNYSAAWLAANVLFGLALIPLLLWVSKRFSDRVGRSPFIQQLMRDIAGHNLCAASEFIATLSEFAEEERAG
jgi:hypothetical protein